MPSVGPQLPGHLTKRKRSIDDDAEDSKTPPFKVQAASAPQDKEKRTLGPAPPPPTTSNPDALDIDSSSSDDDYGPALSKAKSPADNPSAPPPKRRVLGPAPPPAPLSGLPPHPADGNASASSDSEDDYGPSLPPAPGSSAAAKAQYEQERAQQQEVFKDSELAKPQRDEWMLLPPSDSDWSSRVDPTKLKNRKFASGKSSKGVPAGGGGGISSLWTETPEEKRKRLADEVLGRVDLSTSASNSTGKGGRSESREDEETARRVREYNERNRGKSLAEQRKRDGGQKEEEDDPSQRGFDREKDMALGGRVGHVQKREMLAKAADFGSRFQKGSYL